MDFPRDHILSDAAFATDEAVEIGLRDLLDELPEFAHGGTDADEGGGGGEGGGRLGVWRP